MHLYCMCNRKSKHLDTLFQSFVVTDTHTISMKMLNDLSYIKENGYYPLKDNIFHKLQFFAVNIELIYQHQLSHYIAYYWAYSFGYYKA